MKTSKTLLRSSFTVTLLFGCAFPLAVSAHQVGDPNGKSTHQHVYKNNSFGTGTTAGHYARPAGSNGIVIWQAAPQRGYAKIQPGFKVPGGHSSQPSQKQMYQQKPVFSKTQNRTPDLNKR